MMRIGTMTGTQLKGLIEQDVEHAVLSKMN